MTVGPRPLSESRTDPLWYKDAVIYELHVRAFFDSNGDGIGDFRGLIEKLPYLQDLGVTAIWLLPFYPSPGLDDGYDIADYNSVHPNYGTMADVRAFIREAHKRGLRVITELVCNHTSDQHPWFQRARNAPPGSAARNFYVWSDNPDRYSDARIIFKDFETSNWTWDPVAGAYYWHRFYHHQPDLNFDNPRVKEAIFRVMDSWLEMGVDGLRLDAVPYLYEREGTICENLPETFTFLRELRSRIDERFPGRMLLAEANQWPEDAVAYFGEGDQCHMAFHFPVMPRLFMGVHMEDRFPIIDILDQTPPIPDNCQWALFLRNHDELTLEMVADEERDYMYRVYAAEPRMRINLGIRRRLSPLLGNHRRRIELMNGLLFSLPGTPVLYYGDEIGMGDNIFLGDRNGVRTPMQWSSDRNAGFSRANPQRLYLPVVIDPEYHYETVNVEAQNENPHSLLWWMRRILALRRRYRALSRGSIEFLHPENRKVLAFLRTYEDEQILVVANLSRFVQAVSLDLSQFRGLIPVELFGRVEFPAITDQPYFLTLGPHSFYWLAIEQKKAPLRPPESPEALPVLSVSRGWEDALTSRSARTADALGSFLAGQRWFGGKGQKVRSVQVNTVLPLLSEEDLKLALIDVAYEDGGADVYALPAASLPARETPGEEESASLGSAIARLRLPENGESLLIDAGRDPRLAADFLRVIGSARRVRDGASTIRGWRTRQFRDFASADTLTPSFPGRDQSNSAIVYGHSLFLKLFRRLEEGINPEIELGNMLTEQGFRGSPRLVGAIEVTAPRLGNASLAALFELVPNEGDAWDFTRDALRDFFERALASGAPPGRVHLTAEGIVAAAESEPPAEIRDQIGAFLESARLLGQRTAELHAALGTSTDPAFAAEPHTPYYQRSLYQSLRNLAGESFRLLRRRIGDGSITLPGELAGIAGREDEVLATFRSIVGPQLRSWRIRTHGDYHLGQVLYTGRDFVIIDFEGEPARPIAERRVKRTPLRDVAGMLRSFSYAVHDVILREMSAGLSDRAAELEAWGRAWNLWVAAAFLRAYLHVPGVQALLPESREELVLLLQVSILEKAVYEISYELNNRPDWLEIPLRGILEILEARS